MKRLICLWLLLVGFPAVHAGDLKLPPLPPPREVNDRSNPDPYPVPPPFGSRMIGPYKLLPGETVIVVGEKGRAVPIYRGMKIVTYLEAQPEPRKLETLELIGGAAWVRLDGMATGTWVQADAVQLVRGIEIGMSRDQILNRIGNPVKVSQTNDSEEWVYELYEVQFDKKYVEGREQHSALVPMADPSDPTRVVLVPQYWETTRRYVVENPFWAKILDKRFVFKEGKLAEIKDMK